MNFLFCDNLFDSQAVDEDFENEYAASLKNGGINHLFSLEALTKGNNAIKATKKIKKSEDLQSMIYRGWMLKPFQYQALYEALLAKNYQLINSPTAYQNCHYLPDSLPFIEKNTPKTVFLRLENQTPDFEKIFDLLSPFGNSPLILKDFVKSHKHDWERACFIPDATDKAKVTFIVENFLALQNTDLNEGLVFREYIDLEDLTIHSKSGMPLKEEYRLFFYQNELVALYDYWEEGDYQQQEKPEIAPFLAIAKTIPSAFFSMDIAKTKNKEWIIIELGDGQVAGIPERADVNSFYKNLIL